MRFNLTADAQLDRVRDARGVTKSRVIDDRDRLDRLNRGRLICSRFGTVDTQSKRIRGVKARSLSTLKLRFCGVNLIKAISAANPPKKPHLTLSRAVPKQT